MIFVTHDDNHLFLVDGSGFIFRAYFAVPQTLTNPDGVPVGAVLGFCNMMTRLLQDFNHPRLAVIFDAARENFRYDLYDQYKANRSETPADLIPQFPLIRQATQAFGIPAIEQEGYEADDLIAAYAKHAVQNGMRVTIVGSDKDLMQLVNDKVQMFDPMKNIFIGVDDVKAKFGVAPQQVVDVQALAGDSVDNIPGVPSIGLKIAAELINEYGDLETLLQNAANIKQPKRRQVLLDHADAARLSLKLVTLDADAPMPVPIDQITPLHLNPDSLIPFLTQQGFASVIARLQAKNPIISMPLPSSPSQQPNSDAFAPLSQSIYTLIEDLDILQQWITHIRECGIVAVDTETTSLTPSMATLVGISLCCEVGKAAYIPLHHGCNTAHASDLLDMFSEPAPVFKQIPVQSVMDALRPILTDPAIVKIAHNAKYDLQIFKPYQIDINPIEDTMLLSYVLDGTQHGHGMDELASLFYGHDTIKFKDLCGTGKTQITFDQLSPQEALNYAAEDAEVTFRLYHSLKPRLTTDRMHSVYEDIERPLIPVIAAMEWAGVQVDKPILAHLSHDFTLRLDQLESDIHTKVGAPFNLASPKQVAQILFETLGMKGGTKTKTGEWSTAAAILEKLADDLENPHAPIVQQILDWRQLAKLKSTYTDALPQSIAPRTGRVHTSFSMAGTNTGRLASSDPNLQNIPIRSEEGRKIRTAFVAAPDHVLISADYSQIELRLAAEMAGIQALKQAFCDDIDVHKLTAAQVFGIDFDHVTAEQRYQAKAVNFGIIYGISGWGLAKQLSTDAQTANQFIRTYLSRFPELQDYMQIQKDHAAQYGYVKTLFGRKCTINGANDKNGSVRQFAERQAINAPLQGTNADIIKMAMARLHDALPKAGFKTQMLLQVHDELIFEAPIAEAASVLPFIVNIMENIVTLSIPLKAEAAIGNSWAQAH